MTTVIILTLINEITPTNEMGGNRLGGTVGVREGQCMRVVIGVLAD